MKTNALIRIILWSLVIIILSSILLGGMKVQRSGREDRSIAQKDSTSAAIIRTDPRETEASKEIPAAGSTEPAAIPQPDPQETEASSEAQTASSTEPAAYLYPASDAPAAPSKPDIAPSTDGQQFSTRGISTISIEWVSGSILILPWEGDTIQVTESGLTDPDYEMVCRTDEGELEIEFCRERLLKGIGITAPSKDLLIQVPKDWTCRELEIDIAAADLSIYDLSIQELDMDGASGSCLFSNCTVGSLSLETAEGDVAFYGSLQALEFQAASAGFLGVMHNVPSRIDMESMSGDLELYLPEDAGFSARVQGMHREFSSDFATVSRDGRYVCGDGACRINLNAISGDVTIRQHHQEHHHGG